MSVLTTVPLIALAILCATCAWVYRDAKANQVAGTPVIFRSGSLCIDTPEAWSISCLVLFFVFLPLYLAARSTTFTGRF
jgi:hypothetical protein